MSRKVEEFKLRCKSSSTAPEYWFKLEADLHKFWETATDKEKEEWKKDWGYGEMLHMMCSGFRYERGKE